MKIFPLTPEYEAAFYALAAEYLPDSDPDRMRRFARLYPQAFLALTVDGQLIGAAFGWPRRHADPADASFTLDGVCIAWDHWRKGYGRRLLAAFEDAARTYGAPAVSVGSAGGFVEEFYLACGYRPREYKAWVDGAPVVEHVYADLADYRAYQRQHADGFVVMEKAL